MERFGIAGHVNIHVTPGDRSSVEALQPHSQEQQLKFPHSNFSLTLGVSWHSLSRLGCWFAHSEVSNNLNIAHSNI